jgi:hypothetical protein
MSQPLAVISFEVRGGPTVRAVLDDAGWRVADGPEWAHCLNLLADLSDYGLADGDPVARAAAAAARILDGAIEYIRTADPVPPDTVF